MSQVHLEVKQENTTQQHTSMIVAHQGRKRNPPNGNSSSYYLGLDRPSWAQKKPS